MENITDKKTLLITTLILSAMVSIYSYTLGYRTASPNVSVTSYNAGFRLGRYSTLSEVIYCDNVAIKAIIQAYRAIAIEVYVKRNEVSTLEYSCGE